MIVNKPVPETDAKLANTPVIESVGLPDIPLPLLTAKPLPETDIVLFTTVFAAVLASIP